MRINGYANEEHATEENSPATEENSPATEENSTATKERRAPKTLQDKVMNILTTQDISSYPYIIINLKSFARTYGCQKYGKMLKIFHQRILQNLNEFNKNKNAHNYVNINNAAYFNDLMVFEDVIGDGEDLSQEVGFMLSSSSFYGDSNDPSNCIPSECIPNDCIPNDGINIPSESIPCIPSIPGDAGAKRKALEDITVDPSPIELKECLSLNNLITERKTEESKEEDNLSQQIDENLRNYFTSTEDEEEDTDINFLSKIPPILKSLLPLDTTKYTKLLLHLSKKCDYKPFKDLIEYFIGDDKLSYDEIFGLVEDVSENNVLQGSALEENNFQGSENNAFQGSENNALQVNTLENNVLQVNTLEENALQVNTLENNALQVNTLENNALQVNTLENTLEENTREPLTSNTLTSNPLTSNPLTSNTLTSPPLTLGELKTARLDLILELLLIKTRFLLEEYHTDYTSLDASFFNIEGLQEMRWRYGGEYMFYYKDREDTQEKGKYRNDRNEIKGIKRMCREILKIYKTKNTDFYIKNASLYLAIFDDREMMEMYLDIIEPGYFSVSTGTTSNPYLYTALSHLSTIFNRNNEKAIVYFLVKYYKCMKSGVLHGVLRRISASNGNDSGDDNCGDNNNNSDDNNGNNSSAVNTYESTPAQSATPQSTTAQKIIRIFLANPSIVSFSNILRINRTNEMLQILVRMYETGNDKDRENIAYGLVDIYYDTRGKEDDDSYCHDEKQASKETRETKETKDTGKKIDFKELSINLIDGYGEEENSKMTVQSLTGTIKHILYLVTNDDIRIRHALVMNKRFSEYFGGVSDASDSSDVGDVNDIGDASNTNITTNTCSAAATIDKETARALLANLLNHKETKAWRYKITLMERFSEMGILWEYESLFLNDDVWFVRKYYHWLASKEEKRRRGKLINK